MSALSPDAAPPPPPIEGGAQLGKGLFRKLVIGALFAGVVFAALALYGDVREL